MKFTLLFQRRWALFYVPILLFCAVAVWCSATFWLPLPPKNILFSQGVGQSSQVELAKRYRDALDSLGVRVDFTTDTDAQAGFQIGISSEAKDWLALAAVERQPVWVFTRAQSITSLSQLKGLRLAAGEQGSSTWAMVQLLLLHAGLKPSDLLLVSKEATLAANDLLDGKLEAMVLVANPDNDLVRLLTRSPGIWFLGVDRIAALIAREPRLKAFVLPQGAIELRGDIPPRDLALVAAQLHLMVRTQTHPAAQRALLDAAQSVHDAPGFLQRQGEYPVLRDLDFPAAPVARTMSLGQRPWLETVLPYYWAQVAELLLYAVIPLLLLMGFMLAWVPHFFDWRVNAILQNHYGELKFLETEIESVASERPMEIKRILHKLDEIELQVVALDLPNHYAPRWYTLRSHLALARDKLLGMRAR